MKRTWTIIGVRDVPTSCRWYQALFGQPAMRPAHPDFGQILDADGTVLLCLHQWGVEDHPSLMRPDEGTPGNGLLLFFRVDDFDMALKRARGLALRLEEDPHTNPNTRTQEFSLRDPDGYYVTISALEGRTGIASESNQSTAARRRRPTRRIGENMKSTSRPTGEAAAANITQRIQELADWRGETLARVRQLIHEADPDVQEEWKWMGTPVWSHDGGVCTGESYKQVVKLTFFRGASIKDPKKLFNSSLEGNTRRAIDIREGEKINAAAFKQLIRAAVAANTAARAQRGAKKT